jgi:hypothetical protein
MHNITQKFARRQTISKLYTPSLQKYIVYKFFENLRYLNFDQLCEKIAISKIPNEYQLDVS